MSGRSGAGALESLVADLDYPMVVVTAADGERRGGCLVGFWTQASIDQPRLLVGLSKRNHTFRIAQTASGLAVHFLGAEDVGLARLFGGETGDDVDKLARVRWSPGPHGAPVIDGVRGWVAGAVIARVDLGDHVGHLVDVSAGAAVSAAVDALTFQQVRGLEPGHEA